MNTFKNIMENRAFASLIWSKCPFFHNIFKYMIFQRHQKALFGSKGLTDIDRIKHPVLLSWTGILRG